MTLTERKAATLKIRKFFLAHPELRPSFFEKKCGIPATTLSHLMSGNRNSLKKVYLNNLTKTLSTYGFKAN